jgi:hypothetical protein
MPFNKQAIFDSQVQHLVSMVRIARAVKAPSLLDYARERAAELESDRSGLFVGLPAAVRSVLMTGGRANAGESDPRSLEKQP